MASRAFNAGINGINNNSIDFLNDTIRVLLINSTYVQDPDSEFVGDIVADEVPATRQTLGTKTVTKDNANDRSVLDAANSTFPAVAGGETIGGAIVYKFVTNDADSILLFFCDTADTATNGGDIVVNWSANGIGYAQI